MNENTNVCQSLISYHTHNRCFVHRAMLLVTVVANFRFAKTTHCPEQAVSNPCLNQDNPGFPSLTRNVVFPALFCK